MKRRLLAVAVGAALSLPMIASAAPSLYGRVDASFEWVDDDVANHDQFEVDSNASRIGVKGDEKLTGDLSAIYMMEWEVYADGAKNDFGMRNRYAGLKSQQFGSLKLGFFDTALKNAEGWVDQFNDHNETDMGFANFGKVIDGQDRSKNTISYESPKFAGGLTARLDLAQGEGSPSSADGVGDAMSASLVYDQNNLYLAAAFIDDDDKIVSTDEQIIRLVGGVTMGQLQLGGLLQNVDDGKDDHLEALVSAAYTMGANTFKAQLTMDDTDDTEAMQVTAGVDHKLSSNTKVYVLATVGDRDNNPNTPANENIERMAVSTGVQIKF